jgi:hypothetical protein
VYAKDKGNSLPPDGRELLASLLPKSTDDGVEDVSSPLINRLVGVIDIKEADDFGKDYTAYLMKKY